MTEVSKRTIANENFRCLLKKIGLEYSELIDELLVYFRQKYTEIPDQYVGDSKFYSMLESLILANHSLEEALQLAKNIIDRELFILNNARRTGLSYIENFRLESL